MTDREAALARLREHTTHYDDCGCLRAAHAERVDAMLAKIDKLERRVEELEAALRDCEEWFDQRADADAQGDPMQYVGNTEMTMLGVVRTALASGPPIDWDGPAREGL